MMILIRLDSEDWLDIDGYVLLHVGTWISVTQRMDYTDDVEEGYTAELIDISLMFVSEDFDQCSDD